MRRHWLPIVAVLLVIPAGGLTWRLARSAWSAPHSASSAPGTQPIPATIGVAERKDVPVYLTGLGTVQAFNTVTVKVRVDGELDKIAFTEGQDVKAGDVLAQIDPRPFRAALDLAQATKAKDQAQLENAKLDLQRYQNAGHARQHATADRHAGCARAPARGHRRRPIRRISKPRRFSSTTRRSRRRCRGAPASGCSTRATSCTPPITTGLVVITQLQPISVIFTLPQDQLQDVIHAMTSASSPLKVVAQGRSNQQQLGEGHAGARRQSDRSDDRQRPSQSDLSQHRTTRSGRANTSISACCCGPCRRS